MGGTNSAIYVYIRWRMALVVLCKTWPGFRLLRDMQWLNSKNIPAHLMDFGPKPANPNASPCNLQRTAHPGTAGIARPKPQQPTSLNWHIK
jgi:hypothetical protein